MVEGFNIDVTDIPDTALAAEIRAYIDEGRIPGAFLAAVLSNDLRTAACEAAQAARLGDWIRFCEDHLPIASWGSPAIVRLWCATHPNRPQLLRSAA